MYPLLLCILLAAQPLPPAVQVPDVPFFETPDAVVAAMLELAEIDADDVVYDLGSGDGRIVIAAARHRGGRGVGIELEQELVERSRRHAAEAGLADRVRFEQGDLFEADFSEATAVLFYLLPHVNRRLRPLLLAQLAPGTPVVSHRYEIHGWEPAARVKVEGRFVFLYRVPAH